MASLEELLENRAQLDPEKIEQLIEAVNTRLEESKVDKGNEIQL